MSVLSALSAHLEVGEARILGAELTLGRPVGMAIAAIAVERRELIRPLLEECCARYPIDFLGHALSAMSEMGQAASTRMDLVWSGPSPDGVMGRRTWTLAQDHISRAKEYIYAATYSAGRGSPFLEELKSASDRGISVTCVVDPHHLKDSADIVRQKLPHATLLALAKHAGQQPPRMHSKFLVVDGLYTFITSANFSVVAATESLETGILVRSDVLAAQMKEHVDTLRSSGELVVWRG